MRVVSSKVAKSTVATHQLTIIKLPVLGRLIVPYKGKALFLKFQDIVYCQAAGNYTTIYMADGRSILSAKCLKGIIEQLPRTQFIRIHQSYLINLSCIEAVGRDEVDLCSIVNALPVSRRYRKLLRCRLRLI